MIIVIISCVACGSNSETKSETQSDSSIVQGGEDNIDSEVDEETLTSTQEDTLMTIETKYGKLYYPKKYQDEINLNQTESDGIITIQCNSNDEKEYLLFTIVIGDIVGDTIGTIDDKDGNTWNVIVDVPELSDVSELDDETQNQLYAMQEAVNVLIENLN